MIKKIFVLSFVIFSFVNFCFALDISAKSAVLYEPETETVLYAKDSETKREIASTTKIMTAVVVLENSDVSEMIAVPKVCVGTEGTSMYLKEGEKLSVSDLLYGLMLQSGNDAAIALAYHTGDGNIEKFVDMMNATAKRIGMKNTCFKNPNGLPAEGHVSTAEDMARLAAYAMKNPIFAKIVSTKSVSVAGRSLTNHNKLLRIYEGACGIKTGYTRAAGRCLVSGAEKNGMRLIAVSLSAPDDWNDHIKMLNFGFDNFSVIKTSQYGDLPAEVDVVGGTQASIQIVSKEEKAFLCKKSDTDEICREVFLPRFVYAPITRGNVIGEVRYTLNGELLERIELVADTSVEYFEEPTMLERILNFFRRK